MARSEPGKRRTAWRDNIEALTVAIVMAVVLKYFIVEAYKIPTGSMQPTLMGQRLIDGQGVFDRILVDKLSYEFRDPRRFEVVIFKYPLDRSKNFVKRVVGMPDEDLDIRWGDVWVRAGGDAEWRVLRRQRDVQRSTWKRVEPPPHSSAPSWRAEGASPWRVDGETISARGGGEVLFVGHGGGSIRDAYTHGYPDGIRDKLPPSPSSAGNEVGDLRVAGRARALPGAEAVEVVLAEGGRRYRFTIPGPAAPPQAAPAIHAGNGPVRRSREDDLSLEAAAAPYRLPAGEWVEFAAQNLDDLLALEIDGETVVELEVPAAQDQASSARISVAGQGADLEDLALYRDIYYTQGKGGPWTIPAGHYFMLGDNTQDSSDSREWTLWNLRWSGPGSEGEVVSGNLRQAPRGSPYWRESNPLEVSTFGDPLIFFRDRWGELNVFERSRAIQLPPPETQEPAPFVPRELITGRALLVFWPLIPGLDVWRLQWIR